MPATTTSAREVRLASCASGWPTSQTFEVAVREPGEGQVLVRNWYQETILDGIEHMPDAFLGLFRGDNIGKMIIRLDGAGV
jgi:NADPH-dependent curcumin reductase CurA